MSLLRKLSLRFDEMIHSGAPAATAEAPTEIGDSGEKADPAKAGRFVHPSEAPFIRDKDYGVFNLRFDKAEDRFITDKGEPMVFQDWYTHSIIFGESGSGKTSFVLNQVYEEMFRSTHLKDGPERENKKLGGLVVEAKGDFAEKTWDLAVKYGRSDDVILFGPTHIDNRYDPFGDPTESPQQLADKMQAVMDSFSGGEKGSDPFWAAASRKLFTQIFHLHRKLTAHGADIPKMSFDLLNLLLLDKGQPRNQGEIDQKARLFQETYDRFNSEMDKARGLCMRLVVDCGTLGDKVEWSLARVEKELAKLEQEIDATTDPERSDQLCERQATAERKLLVTQGLQKLLEMDGAPSDYGERLVPRLERLRKDVSSMLNAADDMERGRYYDDIIQNANDLREAIAPRVGIVAEATHLDTPENLERLRNALIDLCDALEKINDVGEQLINWEAPEPQTGMLKRMLNQYEEIVVADGGDPTVEPVLAYFYEEYLNPANDKTSGSVAMTASNLVNLFIHPPFNQIFTSDATFNMQMVIDHGKMVTLHMPQAKYGIVFNISSLILKVDFFRCVLSRKAITIKDPHTGENRLLNQHRPLTYLCDEFASIATTGETTGEAGFLDKCREYKCACILAVQSKPMLLKKLKESEVDAILTNCGIKIFLRNTDEKTTQMASKVLGSEIKVNPHNTQSATEEAFRMDKPMGHRGFNTSYGRQPKYDPSKFAQLKNGEAIVKLNPRFGSKQAKKVAFSLHIVKSIDKQGVRPVPEVI